MRNINDEVTVRFLGKLCSGKIVALSGHGGVFYQVLLDNEQHTCLWFGADEIN